MNNLLVGLYMVHATDENRTWRGQILVALHCEPNTQAPYSNPRKAAMEIGMSRAIALNAGAKFDHLEELKLNEPILWINEEYACGPGT